MAFMVMLIRFASVILTAFMLGSIPTSYLLGRFVYGVDPRDVGSGATGATNTARAMGALAGIITAVVDIAKGWGAVMIAQRVLVPPSLFGDTASLWAFGVAMLAVVAGHAFTPWLGFKGGKGIAAAGGGLLALSAPLFFVELLILIVVAMASGYVALGSILVALNFPIALAILPQTRHPALVFSCACVALLIIWLHRENIARLLAGTENRFSFGKAGAFDDKERESE